MPLVISLSGTQFTVLWVVAAVIRFVVQVSKLIYCGEPETAAEETSSGPAEGESTTTTGGWTLDIPRPWSLVSDVIGRSVYNCLKIWHPVGCLVAIVSADCDSYFVGLP